MRVTRTGFIASALLAATMAIGGAAGHHSRGVALALAIMWILSSIVLFAAASRGARVKGRAVEWKRLQRVRVAAMVLPVAIIVASIVGGAVSGDIAVSVAIGIPVAVLTEAGWLAQWRWNRAYLEGLGYRW